MTYLGPVKVNKHVDVEVRRKNFEGETIEVEQKQRT